MSTSFAYYIFAVSGNYHIWYIPIYIVCDKLLMLLAIKYLLFGTLSLDQTYKYYLGDFLLFSFNTRIACGCLFRTFRPQPAKAIIKTSAVFRRLREL